MKNLNDYGFYSGGYIFDRLDRAALRAVRKKWAILPSEQLYTSWAAITFIHQLCDLDKTKCFVDSTNMISDSTYEVQIGLSHSKTRIASATFWFKKAKKNYCKLNKGD